VTVDPPTVAVLLAASVSTLVPVAGLVPNAAVTPLGNPDAERVTLPVNPPTSLTVIVSVAVLLCVTVTALAEGASVKLEAGLTVSAIAVDAVREPEVPVTVTVDVPAVAVLLAVNVSTLLPVVGLVPNAAVTPLGKPDAARVTLPVNPPTSVTAIVSVALLPWVNAKVEAEGASVKLPDGAAPFTVQLVPLSKNDVGIALVTLFHAPLNPILE